MRICGRCETEVLGCGAYEKAWGDLCNKCATELTNLAVAIHLYEGGSLPEDEDVPCFNPSKRTFTKGKKDKGVIHVDE